MKVAILFIVSFVVYTNAFFGPMGVPGIKFDTKKGFMFDSPNVFPRSYSKQPIVSSFTSIPESILIPRQIPDGTLYNFTGTYSINATITTTTDAGSVTYDIIQVSDASNQRFIAAAVDGRGSYLINQFGSFVFGSSVGGACFSNNFTYQQEVIAYSNAFHTGEKFSIIDRHLVKLDQWTGLVQDFAACNTRDSLYIETIETSLGAIFSTWSYGQNFPIGTVCSPTRNIITYDVSTFRTHVNSAAFTLPPACNSPFPYCATFYNGDACTK